MFNKCELVKENIKVREFLMQSGVTKENSYYNDNYYDLYRKKKWNGTYKYKKVKRF